MDLSKRPVWVTIHLDRLVHNLNEVKKRVGSGPLVMAVVKANAYGHGMIPAARAALAGGADRLAVALIEEGVALRQAGFKVPIQAMGGFVPEQIESALDADIILTIGTFDQAREVAQRAQARKKEAVVHLKVDTGMGRYGLLPEDARNLIEQIHRMPGLRVEGLMSHMASADERDKAHTNKQFHIFRELINSLQQRGIEIPIKHIANSATVIDLPEMALDMVRPGIMLYGLWPSPAVQKNLDLKPVLAWKARLVQIKELPAGTAISYGCTYIAKKAMRVGLLPVGYADGFNRLLSNRGTVLAGNGREAPVVGRVCMDQTVIDISGIDGLRVGDEAVIIGEQNGRQKSADEIADMLNTINYEVVSMISKRVPRFYVGA